MKPYISVVFPTMRPGGLDVVFSSLENQIFKDFELIFADNLYDYRKDIVKEKAKQYSIKYKHVPPIVNKFPVHSYCHTINSAISHASGDVIFLTLDYRYFTPWTLQKHAEFHKASPDNFGFASPTKRPIARNLKHGLPDYGNSERYEQYIKDLDNGKLDDYMWSIFENEFGKNSEDPSTWELLDRTIYGHDPKVDFGPGTEVDPILIFLHSESIKQKIVLGANGLNEALDGAHSHQDIEFSHRLRNLYDFKWITDNTNITYRIGGGHGIVYKLKLIEKIDNSAATIFEKYKNGSKDPVNNWSLAEVNAENKKL